MSTNPKITARYGTLPLISFLLKLLGYIVLATSVVSGAHTVITARPGVDLTGLLIAAATHVFAGVGQALILIAAAEIIHVLMDIEANTRRAADGGPTRGSGSTPKL